MATPRMHPLDGAQRVSLKRILFATDFSVPSELAIPYVKKLVRYYGATLVVAHVLSSEASYCLGFERRYAETAMGLQPPSVSRMREFLQMHRLTEVPHEVLPDHGDEWLCLPDYVVNHRIDLVVIARPGCGGTKKSGVASLAESVVRHCACPVVTVGPHVLYGAGGITGAFREILYATDFHPASARALPHAIAATERCDAHLTMLHVIPESLLDVSQYYPNRTVTSAKQSLKELARSTEGLRQVPELLIEIGSPAERILQVGEVKAADLIIMGAHSAVTDQTRPEEARTVNQVIRQARCPVLTTAA